MPVSLNSPRKTGQLGLSERSLNNVYFWRASRSHQSGQRRWAL